MNLIDDILSEYPKRVHNNLKKQLDLVINTSNIREAIVAPHDDVTDVCIFYSNDMVALVEIDQSDDVTVYTFHISRLFYEIEPCGIDEDTHRVIFYLPNEDDYEIILDGEKLRRLIQYNKDGSF